MRWRRPQQRPRRLDSTSHHEGVPRERNLVASALAASCHCHRPNVVNGKEEVIREVEAPVYSVHNLRGGAAVVGHARGVINPHPLNDDLRDRVPLEHNAVRPVTSSFNNSIPLSHMFQLSPLPRNLAMPLSIMHE
eukprot:m.337074 g.337074  ORF g.337074 m.337074 type:complete len:135 (+) comp16533_c1_seq4:337-741(+)